MRFFSLVFALYFVVLGCLPCTDEVLPAGREAAYAVTPSHRSHDDPGEIDWCSPLCQCSCCPGAVVLVARVVTLVYVPAPLVWCADTYAPAGPDALPVRPLAAPWQPPQGA